MRVIGGTLKGRRFNPPNNLPARPTTDFAKEGLFNILNNHFDFEEVAFLDLFAGTGSLDYEMASRGSEDIVCVEKDGRSVEFIKKTAAEYKIEINVMRMDVFEYIRSTSKKFDIIFAGPPYPLENIPQLPVEIFEMQLLKPGGWFILETNPKHKFDDHPNFREKRNYGTTIFHIFENKEILNEKI